MNFGEYARLGEHHDVMEALTLLTKAYINMIQPWLQDGCLLRRRSMA